jgi:hypothetical protein
LRQISLIDFAPLSGTDWYPALREALAYLAALGGGRLHVPNRPAPYACNVTTVIPITSNDIEIELEAGAVLENTSASGVEFFQFAGTAGTRNRVNFRGGRILSGVSAGHVFTFAPGLGLGFADWTSEIAQLNPAKSILIWTGVSGSGLFTNRFGGPNWEHGSVSTPPSVPAVDINKDANPEDVVDTDRFNVFNDNTFAMQRCTCHFGTKPFFSFINDGPSVGAFYSHNSVSIRTIERAHRGFIKIAGALGFVARDCAFYDSYYVDGHLIETTAGKRGRACEQCHFEDIEVVSVSGGLVGVADTHKPVTSLTLSGSTATATAMSHGFKVGQRVYVSGAEPEEYNGRFTVVWRDDNSFKYVVSDPPATPITGTIAAEVAAMTIAIGASDARHTFGGIGGNRTSTVEVDLNNCGALVLGDHDRCGYYRASTTLSTVLGEGAEARVDTPAVNTDTIAERRSGGGITLLGQNIKAVLSFSAAVDLPSLGAGTTALVAVTATGVKTGDRLIFHPNLNGPGPGAPTTTADLVIGVPWISDDDQISFIVHNPTGSSIDSSNRTWHGLVFRP